MKKSGKMIGHGAWKVCYAVKDLPWLVMIIGYDNKKHAREEEHALRTLRRNGIAAFHGRVEKVLDEDGKTQWALVGPRYDFHTLASDGDPEAYRDLNITAGHVAALRKIRAAIVKKRVFCNDLQFLFRGDSEVVVSDPGDVRLRAYGQDVRCNARAIQAMIRSRKVCNKSEN